VGLGEGLYAGLVQGAGDRRSDSVKCATKGDEDKHQLGKHDEIDA